MALRGAKAVLLRSFSPLSIKAGWHEYRENDIRFRHKKIPVAAITVDDADMFQRMEMRGKFYKLCFSFLTKLLIYIKFPNILKYEIKCKI